MRQAFCDCGRPILAWTKYRRKVIRPKGDHDLCQKCWKAERDRSRVAAIPVIEVAESRGGVESRTRNTPGGVVPSGAFAAMPSFESKPKPEISARPARPTPGTG